MCECMKNWKTQHDICLISMSTKFDRFVGRLAVAAARSGFHNRGWRETKGSREEAERSDYFERWWSWVALSSSPFFSVSFSLHVCMAGDKRSVLNREGRTAADGAATKEALCPLFSSSSSSFVRSLSIFIDLLHCLASSLALPLHALVAPSASLDSYLSVNYSLPLSSAFCFSCIFTSSSCSH